MQRTASPALRRCVAGGAAFALAATMVACGSDDSGDTQAAETSAAADPAEFCEASVNLEAAFSQAPPIDDVAPPEEQQAGLEEFGATLQPLLADVEETAPEEVADQVTTATGLVRDALETGDTSTLDGIARINDDVTLPLEQLLPLPEEQIFSMITFTGAAFAEPGASDTVFLRLEPGRYGAACFIPQGTTHDTEGTGPPHFTLGMFAEFAVE